MIVQVIAGDAVKFNLCGNNMGNNVNNKLCFLDKYLTFQIFTCNGTECLDRVGLERFLCTLGLIF